MTEPVRLNSQTPSFNLPLLFAGQAQKEFFINRAFAQIDALMTGTIEGVYANPPENPIEGDTYIVAAEAQAEWQGYESHIAIRIADSWQLVPPRSGMLVFDKTAGCIRIFRETWSDPTAISSPAGGTTQDVEARAAIEEILASLRKAGILTA